MAYNPISDQLKQMEDERKKLLAALEACKPGTFEHEQASATLKAHDVEVGRLLGI